MSAVRQETRSAPKASAPRSRPRRAEPAQPRRHLSRAYAGRHLGPVPLGPLIAWQVALALGAVAYAYGGWLYVVAAPVLLVVAVSTLFWFNGRPLWRWARVWLANRTRNARAKAARPDDPALVPLREWIPALELASVAGRRGGRSVGVAYDGSGYVVLLGPDTADLIASADPVNVPLQALTRVGEVEGIRLTGAQLLVRMIPAPSPTLGPYAQQLAASYQEINVTAAPAVVSWWIALRLEPSRDGTSLTLDGQDADAVRRALRTSVGWATKVLSSSGLPCRALEDSELREVLALSLGVDPLHVPADPRARRTRETWRGWSCDGSAHTTGWVRGWPRRAGLAGVSRLLSAVGGLPVTSATVALTFSWTAEHAVRCSSFVRVTADNPKAARSAFRQLGRRASRSRLTLVRLDGEQLPGVLATIPLGGGAA